MELGIAFIAFFAILAVIGLILALFEIVKRLKAISRISMYLYKNRSQIGRLVKSLEECVQGKNKINQDAVDTNIALVNEVIKLRTAIDRFVSAVAPPPEQVQQEYSPRVVEERFDTTYRDLLDQGLDPERAKWRAAEYELEAIAGRGMDENMGIGA